MAYYPATPFVSQFFTDPGIPLSGGTLSAYLADSTTPTPLYIDDIGTSAGAVITLNARGEPQVSGNTVMIWLDSAVSYKFVLADAAAINKWTVNDIANINYLISNTSNVAQGDALVGVKRTATNAIATTLHNWIEGQVLSVFDFMTAAQIADVQAKTLLVDVSTAVQTGVTYIASVGGKLIFPTGSYLLSTKITGSTSKTVVIEGVHSRSSHLIWTNSDGGIQITYTDENFPAHISGLSLLTRSTALGTALKVIGPTIVNSTLMGSIFNDLDIEGEDRTTDCWQVGIHAVNIWYPNFNDLFIKGQTGDITLMTDGIRFDLCMVPRFENITIFHALVAINQAGATNGEGIAICHSELVGVQYGIVLTGNSGNDSGSIISGVHINAYIDCVKMTNRHGLTICDNLFYKAGGTADWRGINVINGGGNSIHDNQFSVAADATGANTCIQLGGTTAQNTVHDNLCIGYPLVAGYVVFLTGSTNNNRIHNNDGRVANVTACILDGTSAKDNVLSNNLPTAIQVFVANDATPSVGNDQNGLWQTANTNPTSITRFDNGYTGQVIHVLVNDANTTFVHGASNITLQGSANYAAGNGAILTFWQDTTAGLWREVSRRTA